MKWGVVHTGGSRCPGQLVWRAWKVKQLNDRLTAEISLCESCQFPLSTLVSWMVKTYTLKWQNSLSTARVIVVFIPQAPFPSLYNWSYMKGNCARKVASNLTQSHFLSVSVCYRFRRDVLTATLAHLRWSDHIERFILVKRRRGEIKFSGH